MPSKPSSSYFGPDEIAEIARPISVDGEIGQNNASTHSTLILQADFLRDALSDRNQDDDIAKAAQYSSRTTFFARWEKITDMLDVSYLLYLHAENEGEAFLKRAGVVPPFDQRPRAPKRGNNACVAVQMVANPTDVAQQKTCSEYSYILISAKSHQVAPGEFASWAQATTLRFCKTYVRGERRKRQPPTKPSPPLMTGYRDVSPQRYQAIDEASEKPRDSSEATQESLSEESSTTSEQDDNIERQIHIAITLNEHSKLFRARAGATFEAWLEKTESGELTFRLMKLCSREVVEEDTLG